MWSIEKYNQAMRFAGHWHKKQRVPGTQISYLLHLAQVAQCTLRGSITEDDVDIDLAMQAAILHDVLEDTACTYQEVLSEFGSPVANGVQALSKRAKIGDRTLSKSEQMDDSLARILKQPKEISMVKLADRITNLQRPPHPWFHRDQKIEIYCTEAQKICDALGYSNSFLRTTLQSRIKDYGQYVQKKQYHIISSLEAYQTQLWQNIRAVGKYQSGSIVLQDGSIPFLEQPESIQDGTIVFVFGTLFPTGIHPLFVVPKVGELPLEVAYRETSYCAEGFVLRIDQHNPRFNHFLQKHRADSWCFVTAFNPQSQSLPPCENKQRNLHLKEEIQSMGYPIFHGVGIPHTDGWEPESSFLVLNITEEAAIQLGRRYDQKAIVYGHMNHDAQLVMLSCE